MRVLIDRQRHTAIEVRRGTKRATLIPMDSAGLSLLDLSFAELDRDWHELEGYPVHRAAEGYIRSLIYIDATPGVVKYLKEILMQYIVNKKTGDVVESSKGKKEIKAAFGKLDETARLETHTIVGDAEGLKELSMSSLVSLYNNMVDPEDQVKKFASKDKGAVQAWDALEAQYDPKKAAAAEKAKVKAEEATTKPAKASKTAGKGAAKGEGGLPREGSKMGNLVAKLDEGGEYSLSDLAEASGYDEQNTRTAIGILRSKKNYPITYDRETKLYTKG